MNDDIKIGLKEVEYKDMNGLKCRSDFTIGSLQIGYIFGFSGRCEIC
jgi:hypothetical protein